MKKCISLWRITQVRLKGTVLKTVRRVKARKGSNPLSSFSGLRPLYCHGCWRFSDITDMIHLSVSAQCFLIIIAGWSSWQLAGLITRRSQVQVLSPQLDASPECNLIKVLRMVPWCRGQHACLSRRRSRVQIPSEPPCGCSLVVKPQPSKLMSGVRFSSPAFFKKGL